MHGNGLHGDSMERSIEVNDKTSGNKDTYGQVTLRFETAVAMSSDLDLISRAGLQMLCPATMTGAGLGRGRFIRSKLAARKHVGTHFLEQSGELLHLRRGRGQSRHRAQRLVP